jgi:DNA polymerase III subunit beta
MSFTIKKQEFFDLLQKVYPIAPAKSSLQILSNIKLACSKGKIEVVATDLDHSIKAVAEVSGEEEFSVAVNARRLFELVREMPEGEVYVEADGTVLVLQSQRGFSCKVAGADSKDFPEFPDVSDANEVKVTAGDLKRMVLRSTFAVSKEASRSCLCGVLWEVEKQETAMVATDGHRLGCCVVKKGSGSKEKVSSIVSPKTLLHVIRITEADENTEITVSFAEKYIGFSTAGFTMCSKLIEGPYPDYEKVIPKTNPKKAIADRAMLIEAARRVSILSNQKTHLVKFAFTRGELEILVLNRDIGGEAREVIPIDYDGEKHVMGFNGQYLSEILSIIDTPRVRLEMNTQISACLVFPSPEKDSAAKSEDLFLIMPLRIMEEG